MGLKDWGNSERLRAHALADAQPGRVYEFFDGRSIPPKTKKTIVVALAPNGEVATVYINSKPAKFGPQHLQVPIVPDGRRIVKHPSFIDCTRIKRRTPLEMLDIIVHQQFRNFTLQPDELATVRQMLGQSPSIPGELKQRFGLG